MAAQVEQRASNGGINNVSLDNIDDDALLSRAERRPLTLSRCRNLYQAPEFVQRITGEDSVLESNTVRFECKVKGFPKPTIKWYKDEEILELDTRISVESLDQGIYALVIADVTKKDEATYRCRIENNEGSSSSTIYLSVKGSSRSPKRRKSSSPNRRIVSYPSLFPTIEEKIVEEEKEEEEVKNQQPSPLSKLYESNKLRSRHTWPKFVGEWAFANDEEDSEAKDTEAAVNPSCHRRSPCGASDDDDVFTDHIVPEITQTTSQQQPNAFLSKSSAKESSDLETSRTTTSESNLSSVPLHTRMDNRPPVPSSSNTSLFVTEPNTHERTMSNSNNNNNNSSSSSNSNVVHSSNTAGGNNNNNNNSNNNNDNNNNRGNISRISVNRPSDNASLSECHSNVDNFGRDHRPSTLTEAVRIPRTIDTENSTTTEGVNRGEMVEDQQDPDQYVSIDETYNIGGGMLTSFVLLTSFTFCALCIKITPGIFMVSIFMATFMFQVIRQLNSM